MINNNNNNNNNKNNNIISLNDRLHNLERITKELGFGDDGFLGLKIDKSIGHAIGVFATRHFKKGDIILKSESYTTLPISKNQCCDGCLKSTNNKNTTCIQLFKCSGCNSVSFCSKECQEKSWELYHKIECEGFNRLMETTTTTTTNTFTYSLDVRTFIINNYKSTNKIQNSLEILECVDRDIQPVAIDIEQQQQQQQQDYYSINFNNILFYLKDKVNQVFLNKYIELVLNNIQKINDGVGSYSLLNPVLSIFNHNSWNNNNAYTINSLGIDTVVATKDINKGQEIFISYQQWESYDRYDFICNARQAIVVAPHTAAKGRPWIWRPAFFGEFASVDKDLLDKGFHVVYYDLTNLYGSPHALYLGSDFYQVMLQYYDLSPKVTLEGFSRGGLFVFNWASHNTDKVACIYVDAPICDMLYYATHWEHDFWEAFLVEWGLTEGNAAKEYTGNPIDNLTPLAQANIPIFSACGDSDEIVPYDFHMKIVAERYRALGGIIEIILKPGCGHHPHSLDKPEPIVDFIIRNQPDYQKIQQPVIHQRDSITNSFLKFTRNKKGCVAFLGGSITEMTGWRDMMHDSLKQRFFDTELTFIDAGIASTGTTPHAFRLENDVLQYGIPDLMFVEAAVNDDTNHFNYIQQTRGMEGIIRHARTINPEMDIIMLHFIYDPFIPLLDKGQQPQVIMNHESVANYYNVASINLAQEIAFRMRQNEFTWNDFGGTHPNWFGHKFYAATINRLMDFEWSGYSVLTKTTVQPHDLPDKSIDPYSYDKGIFQNICSTQLLNDWSIVSDWTPTDVNIGTRKGFVHVPMLITDKQGASLLIKFYGRAVGIFCVAGPQACVLEYSVDGLPFKTLNTFTEWSDNLYLPWVYMFETELTSAHHTLHLCIAKGDKTECQIRNFVINQ